MEESEFLILESLLKKIDPLVIAKKHNIKLSIVIQVMQNHPELVPTRYRSVLGIEDRVEQIKELMNLRRKVASSIPFDTIVGKLRVYLKKPRSSYECLNYIKQSYKRFYAAVKNIGVVRANALSPLSVDLLLSKKAAKRLAKKEFTTLEQPILDWRKKEIDKLYAQHKVTIMKVEGREIVPIEEEELYKFIGLNVYTDSLYFVDYLSFITPVDYFFDSFSAFEQAIGTYTLYQRELILGICLRRKFIDLLGFPKDSIYYSDSPYYPLFMLQNRSADQELVNIGVALNWIYIDKSLARKLRLQLAVEEVLAPDLMEKAAISMNHLLEKFEIDLRPIVKDLCWQKTPIFLELIKYLAYYKQEYRPPDLVDLVLNKNILEGSVLLDESEIWLFIAKQMKANLINGLKSTKEFTFNDIVESLFFNMDRYPFAFYLLARLSGIPTFYKSSEFYLKRMTPRKPTVYEHTIMETTL
jgi:hypothetical protein